MNSLLSLRRRQTDFVVTLEEVHTYTQDLQRIVMLRDKTSGPERDQYNTEIDCMQIVLAHLNEALRKTLQAQAR